MRVRLANPIVFGLSLVLVLGWAVTVQGLQTKADPNPPEAQEAHLPAIDATSPLSTTVSHATFLPVIGADVAPVYRDDFSNPGSGWYVGSNGNVEWGYRSGGYEIKLNDSGWWGAVDAPWSGRVSYAVASDMRQLTSHAALYGLIFGFRDWGRFYVLVLNPSDQQYTLLKRTPAPGWVAIVPWSRSTMIRQGTLPNRLRIERNGSDIAIYINGRLVRTTRDSAYLGVTRVGLYASAPANVPATARFDNFDVWALGSAADHAGAAPLGETPTGSPGMSSPDAPQP